jgi:antirestriction protein ArdC
MDTAQGQKFVDRVGRVKGNSARTILALQKGVERIVKGGNWVNYLKFRASFHQYSWSNQFLIWSQCPGASRVAGFKAWQKLGRQVRKGQKGLSILAPIMIKDRENEGESKLIGFRAIYVWDISQTDGNEAEVVSPVRLLTDTSNDPSEAMAYLLDHARLEGLTVEFPEVVLGDPGVNGCFWFDKPLIQIKGTNPRTQQAKTLAHELAHYHLKHGKVEHDVSKSIAEVEAESTAYMVMQRFGIDSGAYSFGYLASWSRGDPGKIVAVAERVCKACDKITEDMPCVNGDTEPLAEKAA